MLCRAAVASACTSWAIMPERSASGRMLLIKCRDQHIDKLTAAVNATNFTISDNNIYVANAALTAGNLTITKTATRRLTSLRL